ncbi:MAG: glycoside hydrolase family 43 protein [Prevotella sp.]|uniref:glycoside hydrolase family 43 protein n=1 Tax=Prevotella sp. TaxID=59823 RepID=UPI0025D3458E|nr:glycoside hydrolase family 43 protein [Prevotella sp.]MCI7118568.1 glycoside hydrolase family 43 protein [Prevotella sp.]
MKNLLLPILALSALSATAQTNLTDADIEGAYSARQYSKRVVCHDPSIVIDDITNPSSPTYYIYGSHLGRGKTTADKNYQEWTVFKTGEENATATNSLFCNTGGVLVNFSQAYSTHAITSVKDYSGKSVTFGNFDANGWQKKGNTVKGMQWAPDVVYNKTMKKWCMYMSLNGDSWCSSIVCFTSDNIEGPWKYQGPVVFSGFFGKYAHNSYAAANDWKNTDLAIATGATSLPERYNVGDKWGTFWPNCIDPCVFYDDQDNLWMSYGSWSGGIFLIKLDKTNGLRDYTYTFPYEVNGKAATTGTANANTTSDPYFGKKIAGGYYVSGEASYIEKIGSHYFLFMSYGKLESNGGYQMRVFRADKPEGPYVDCNGTSAVTSRYLMNYSAKAADNRGVLLFGGYKWDPMSGAEIAQGHNSAFNDKQGRSFVVYHSRFSNQGEGHQVRVHQLFLNDEGWIMAAPFEFDGETITNNDIATKASIADSEIAGDYQFMRHEYGQDTEKKAYETPVNIRLNADGTITGAEKGTWERTAGTDYIHLTINGVVYRGVLVRQTIDYTNIPAVAISALSSSSGSTTLGQKNYTKQQEVWAVKADAKAAIKYTANKMSLPFDDGTVIEESLTLPTEGLLGANVSWKSGNESVLASDGTVMGKGEVTMTMTISKDNYVYTKDYTLKVEADVAADAQVYYPESMQKNTDAPFWVNFSKDYYKLKKGGKAEFKFYNYSNKKANWDNWCLVAATAERGAEGYAEHFALRADNYGWFAAAGGNTAENTSNIDFTMKSEYNWDTFLDDMDGSLVDMNVEFTTGNVVKVVSTITTKAEKVYNYSFTMKLVQNPSDVTLFFVNEGSYIDGSGIATGIKTPVVITKKAESDGKWYNLNGQQVDRSYKGIVVVNGRKFFNK